MSVFVTEEKKLVSPGLCVCQSFMVRAGFYEHREILFACLSAIS